MSWLIILHCCNRSFGVEAPCTAIWLCQNSTKYSKWILVDWRLQWMDPEQNISILPILTYSPSWLRKERDSSCPDCPVWEQISCHWLELQTSWLPWSHRGSGRHRAEIFPRSSFWLGQSFLRWNSLVSWIRISSYRDVLERELADRGSKNLGG